MDDFSVLFLDYPSYLQMYQKIRRFKDPLLLETTLIKKRRSNETFMLKEENALAEEKFHEYILTLKQLIPLNKSRFFTKFVRYSYTRDAKSGLYTLFLIYEFCEYNLEKEILFRMKNNQRFEENYLVKLMSDLTEAVLLLKKMEIPCFEIAPQNIFLEKIGKNRGFESIKLKYFYKNAKNPLNLDKIPDYDKKSEVFNIGSLVLYLAGIANINSLKTYQKPNEFLVSVEKIDEKLEVFTLFYSKKLLGIIKSMLEVEIARRPDLSEIQMSLIQKPLKTKSSENPLTLMNSSGSSKTILTRRLSTKISTTSFSTDITNKFPKSPNKMVQYMTKSINLMTETRGFQPKTLKKHNSYINKSTNSSEIKGKSVPRNNSASSSKGHSDSKQIETPSWKTRESHRFVINSTVNLNLFNESKATPIESLSGTPKNSIKQETPKSGRSRKEEKIGEKELKNEKNEKKSRDFSSEEKKSLSPSISMRSSRTSLKKPPLSLRKSSRKTEIFPKTTENEIKNSQILKAYAQELISDFEKKLSKMDSITKKSYEDGSIYHGQLNASKEKQHRSGIGIYYYPQHEIYAGEWFHDKFHGKGIYIYDNFEVFEGELKDGFIEGTGSYRYLDGSIYEGAWMMNRKHGFGVLNYCNNGEKYEGNWENGEKEGAGVYYFKNGNKFEGFWKKGQKSGKGKVFFADGSVFEGEWKLNSPNGLGRMIYANGDIYEGNFLCGIKEGDGIYIHKVGVKYEGTIKNDGICQEGIYCYSNNDKYIGKIKDSKREEYGEYYYSNGAKYLGQWKNNLKNGVGVLHLGDSSYYDGNWVDGKRDGFGVMIYKNGEKFEGFWKNDVKDLKGKYTWPNGSTYEGEWKEDKMNGKGIYTNENGEKFIGMWIDNVFVK